MTLDRVEWVLSAVTALAYFGLTYRVSVSTDARLRRPWVRWLVALVLLWSGASAIPVGAVSPIERHVCAIVGVLMLAWGLSVWWRSARGRVRPPESEMLDLCLIKSAGR